MTNNDMKDKILKNVKENIAISNIKEELKNENKGNKNVKYSVLSACAVVLIVGIVFINNPFGRSTDTAENQNISINDTLENSMETDIIQNIININKIEKPEKVAYNEIALMLNDFKVLQVEELEEYYKTKILPNYIPDNLSIKKNTFGFYEKNENIYYDQNSLIYEDKESNKILSITVAKERKIHYDFDFRNHIENTYNASTINNKEVTIFNFEFEDYIDTPANVVKYNCYYTNFEKDGTCFDITSYNIEEEEFIKILSSLL